MAKQSSLNLSTILLVGIIILVVLAGWFGYNASKNGGATPNSTKSNYQAVFLTNGQVYFGHLVANSGQFMKLNNVFYLQANNNLQSGGAEQAANDLTLVKLGKELHGPTDSMVINRDQVLFFEDLKTDSKVVKAISEYKPTGQ